MGDQGSSVPSATVSAVFIPMAPATLTGNFVAASGAAPLLARDLVVGAPAVGSSPVLAGSEARVAAGGSATGNGSSARIEVQGASWAWHPIATMPVDRK